MAKLNLSMTYREASEYNSVCDECCNNLKSVFHFCLKCLASRRQIEDYTSQLMVHSTQKDIPTVSLLNNFHMKQEVDIESGVLQQEIGQLDITNIKEEIDIEEHELLFLKSEPTEIESSSINSEHEQYSDVDEPPEIDLAGKDFLDRHSDTVGPSAGGCGDNVVKEVICDENTLRQMQFPGPTQNKSRQCTLSNKKFSRAPQLKEHISVNTEEILSYKCTVCDKKFPYSSYLARHLLTHTGKKPFECTVCNKKFTRSHDLKLHERIHTNETPFECTICDKKFSRPSGLKSHIRVHTGEKPYECTICDKAFSHQSHVAVHLRTHTGEKPYACTKCDKKFSHSSNVEQHLRVHTGEKPYECTLCDKKFSRAFSVESHMRIHTREKPYACTVCDEKFSRSSTLAKHLRTHTGEQL